MLDAGQWPFPDREMTAAQTIIYGLAFRPRQKEDDLLTPGQLEAMAGSLYSSPKPK